MGYLVETTGRLLLPLDREAAAFDALVAAMADRQGWFRPDDEEWPVTSLADLATYAAAAVTRDGDWLVLSTDEAGDPKWSDQADAFYEELARWVTEGTVSFTGEDGMPWSVTYAEGRMTRSETDEWDEPAELLDDEPAAAQPAAAPPARRRWFRRR